MPGNVGVLRAKRMVNWLLEEGFRVNIIRAGIKNSSVEADFGRVITIADPLKIYGETVVLQQNQPKEKQAQSEEKTYTQVTRKPNKFRRWLAYVLFTPDLTLPWAKKVGLNQEVLHLSKNCGFVLASSPPESAYLAASRIARYSGAKFIMDMRDGWLDEPLKPLLQSSAIQKMRESRLEKRMITQANTIFVTSGVWKSKLLSRYPHIDRKTVTLTNAYPTIEPVAKPYKKVSSGRLQLLYAGRISSSGSNRRISVLMNPLLDLAKNNTHKLDITFLGNLVEEEEQEIFEWKQKFEPHGCQILRHQHVPHSGALELMQKSDVLLLLSASEAAIPAKFFDYVACKTPIICATPENSALQKAAQGIPQCFCFDPANPHNLHQLTDFLDSISKNQISTKLPEQFELDYLKQIFIKSFITP
ncbi:MAG: hypothetical protein LAT57_00415 [Balneolales bacterium]|nr:hypothetical protein [Balneolales bacterium]